MSEPRQSVVTLRLPFVSTALLFATVGLLQAEEPAVLEPELRQELLDMYAADQQARVESLKKLGEAGFTFEKPLPINNPQILWLILSDGAKHLFQDAQHRERLRAIIDRHGWPGKSLVGERAASAAWLLVQHADIDVPLQRRCLALMEAAPTGEVSLQNIAYLTDRVRINEGREQVYGSQLGDNFKPQPIEDEANVDARRAKVGLPPLAEYVETTKAEYEKLLKRE